MPIGKDEWDAGRKWETLEARILLFLRNNASKAFTANDIYRGLGYRYGSDFWGFIGGVAALWAIGKALETLVKEGSIQAKIIKQDIGEETYYMAA